MADIPGGATEAELAAAVERQTRLVERLGRLDERVEALGVALERLLGLRAEQRVSPRILERHS